MTKRFLQLVVVIIAPFILLSTFWLIQAQANGPSNLSALSGEVSAARTYGLAFPAGPNQVDIIAQAGDLPDGVSQEWWAGVQEQLRREQYYIEIDDNVPGGYRAYNGLAGLAFIFDRQGGFAVKAVQPVSDRAAGSRPDWGWSLQPTAVGYGRQRQTLSEAEQVSVSQNRAMYGYGLGDNVTNSRGWKIREELLNTERGLKQTFFLNQRPSGHGGNHPLTLELTSGGGLIPRLADDGQRIILQSRESVDVLHYDSLLVTDATGRQLPSHFEIITNAERSTLHSSFLIIVDDQKAVYPLTIDPLIGPAAFSDTGENSGDSFGTSVAGVGDINGDGYGDVIVGAFGYPAGSNRGRVYVYHGSAGGLSSSPAISITGESVNDRFGISVAGAGDVNGDGYADVIIGADYYPAGSNRGKVYVYHGGSSGLSSSPAFTVTGENNNDRFGRVAGVGDINGDGYADVIVSAYAYPSGGDTGKVYVYHGSSSGLSSSPATSITGQNTNDRFGIAVAGAGDVNGDGYVDVIVGADRYPSSDDNGKVYVYHGSSGGLSSSPAFTVVGENINDSLGSQVAGAGDVNGDGYADIIVGAWRYPASSFRGKVYVYQGSSSGLSSSPAFSATGESNNDQFGRGLAGAGDVNGDGYADIIIGARAYSSNNFQGKVYVYHGSASGLSSSSAFTVTGENNGDYFGGSVAGAGDVNGDGYADVIVGASAYPSGSNQGKAYVYHGSSDGLSDSPNFTTTGENNSDSFGYPVASAGDVNGDGYGDVIVGANAYPSGSNRGKAYVYYGSSSGLSSSPAFTATGENTNDRFGIAVAGAGDVNGDGYADVIVGADYYPAGSNRGRVYVYHGSSSGLSSSPAFTTTGENTNDRFGIAVAGAGDVNGDGYSDVIVGAYAYPSGGDRGKVYVYHGSSSGLSSSPALSITGENINDRFGVGMAGAGDVNGDGYADVIVGADRYPSSGDNGKVYVYHGSSSGLSSSPAFTAVGENINDSLGSQVAGAGDVNGDGYADIIVGASRYPANNRQGKVYVYHGGSSGLNSSPAFTVTGENIGDWFGLRVAGAGDVNGDGYADVIVGARAYPSDNYQGKVYVYHGSSSGLSGSPAFTATGENNDDRFGNFVASAGDLNGDGYADVIVGANAYPSDSYQGKVYVYHGNDGGGRLVLAQQQRGDGSGTPVQPWGTSHISNTFYLNMNATSPRGRERVKIEAEACPAGAAFGTVGCQSYVSTAWTDVTATGSGVSLTVPVDSLTTDNLYRWRARVLYAPYTVNQAGVTAPANPAHGSWRRLNGQVVEADIRPLTGDTTPTPPMLVSPPNGTITNTTTLSLTWQVSPSPDVAGYLLDWNGTVIDVGNVADYTVGPLSTGIYTWTVAAYDAVNNTSPYTDTWSFTICEGVDPTQSWHTFHGSGVDDSFTAMATDVCGNVYVVGSAAATWGSPVNGYAGGGDVVVAKFNGNGTLLWHTFLGSSGLDDGWGIKVDSLGNVFVAGTSDAGWGTPVRAHQGSNDTFVAKLNNDGVLQWHTFVGAGGDEIGYALTLDQDASNAYVGGWTTGDWGGTPKRSYTGGDDAFVAKLSSDTGVESWHTFLGSGQKDETRGLASDSSGNVYVTGYSNDTWDTPVDAYTGSSDAFVAKLNSGGTLQWHTFMGANGLDYGLAVATSGTGSVYVTGESDTGWGSPLHAHQGNWDALVAKFNAGTGARTWHTFIGSSNVDEGFAIAIDTNENIHIAGDSYATWGTPESPHTGASDVFAARLDSDGALHWNTFLGSTDQDFGRAVAITSDWNFYLAGRSLTTWGTPLNAYSGSADGLVAKIALPDVRISKTAPVKVGVGNPLTYTLTITNRSPFALTNLVITDTLPIGVDYVSGGTKVGNAVSLTLDSLAANDGVAQPTFIVAATNAATDVVVNNDYRVSSAEGYNASSSQPVTTAILHPPVLLSPPNNHISNDTTPTLSWQPGPSPDVAGYLLNWNGVISDVGDVTQVTLPTQANGVYTWTVAAHDINYISAYTEVWSLEVDIYHPEVIAVNPSEPITTGENTLHIPANMLPTTVTTLTYTRLEDPTPGPGQPENSVDVVFNLEMVDTDNQPITDFTTPIFLTIRYDEQNIPVGVSEDNLNVFYYTGGQWQQIPEEDITRHPESDSITVQVSQPGEFMLAGSKTNVYLPLVLKN